MRGAYERRGVVLHVATCLWDANEHTARNSGSYSELDAEKLYRGFARNLTIPFRFVVFVDRDREFAEPRIEQERLSSGSPTYGHFTEPYRLNEPMILVGLDTIILRNIDHLAEWCFTGDKVALPRDFRNSSRSINGVALVPKGWRRIFDEWRGEKDMEWLRGFPWQPINDKWPGQCTSFKLEVRPNGLLDSRIVYFHGRPKPSDVADLDWVQDHWR